MYSSHTHSQKIRPGSRLQNRITNHPARVMTIAEGWVMVRPNGGQPVLVYIRDLHLKYEVTKW